MRLAPHGQENCRQLWKITAIGMALVTTTAVITGIVVANWVGRGGLLGAGGGTLYGLNENKNHDQAYREAYGACMRSHGYNSNCSRRPFRGSIESLFCRILAIRARPRAGPC